MSASPASLDERPAAWRGLHISWYAVILLGFLVYEFTAQPGLAAAVTCAKFGWSDWRVAIWLRRVDPDGRRGRTSFWFYLAFGLWKVAILATGMMLVLLMLGTAGNPQQPPARRLADMSPPVIGVILTAGVCFGMSVVLTYIGLWSALRHGVKVWLGAAPRRALVERYWPPCTGEHNAAPFVAVTALIVTLWFGVLAIALVSTELGIGMVACLLLAVLTLASPLTMAALKFLESRIFARSPAECWPADDFAGVYEFDAEASAA